MLHMGLGAAPFSGHQLTFTQPSTGSFLCSSALQMHQGISISVAYRFWCVCYDLTPPWPCTRNPLQNSIWFSCAVSYIIAWSKWRCFPVRLVKFASENKHQKCWVRKSHLHVMWEKNNFSAVAVPLLECTHSKQKEYLAEGGCVSFQGVFFLTMFFDKTDKPCQIKLQINHCTHLGQVRIYVLTQLHWIWISGIFLPFFFSKSKRARTTKTCSFVRPALLSSCFAHG